MSLQFLFLFSVLELSELFHSLECLCWGSCIFPVYWDNVSGALGSLCPKACNTLQVALLPGLLVNGPQMGGGPCPWMQPSLLPVCTFPQTRPLVCCEPASAKLNLQLCSGLCPKVVRSLLLFPFMTSRYNIITPSHLLNNSSNSKKFPWFWLDEVSSDPAMPVKE